MAAADAPELRVSMGFLERNLLYETTRPYTLDYVSTNIPESNQIHVLHHDVPLRDLRGIEHQLTFHDTGFAVLDVPSAMTYDDFADVDKVVRCYFREVGAALLDYLQAASVRIFDFAIRKRDPAFPDPSRQFSGREQPARNAHIDTSERSLIDFIRTLHREEAEQLLKRRYMCVNVWKPLKGPVHDWPLAVCDASSVSPDTDLVVHDNVVSQLSKLIENVLVYYNPKQRWYYLSNQMPSEWLVFRQHDSDGNTAVPHVSFPSPAPAPPDAVPYRESIEIRALVYF